MAEELDYISCLPFDIFQHLLLNYVGPQQTAKLCMLNRKLHSLCGADELWKPFCSRELGVPLKQLETPVRYEITAEDPEDPEALRADPQSLWNPELIPASPFSFKEFYSRLLFPLRGLFNWYQTSRSLEWNETLTITVNKGLIRGETWYPPDSIDHKMVAMPDFVIFIDEATNGIVIRNEFIFYDYIAAESLNGYVARGAAASLCAHKRPSHASFGFRSHPLTARRLKSLQDLIVNAHIAWPQSSSVIRRFQGPASDKLMELFDSNDNRKAGQSAGTRIFYPHLPMVTPYQETPEDLPEGVFKGKFGASGVDLVSIVWGSMPNSEPSWPGSRFLTGFRTTADPTKTSSGYLFLFRMAHRISCSQDDQADVDKLTQLENGPFLDSSMAAKEETFRLPDGFSRHGSVPVELLPQKYTWRFVGRGSFKNQENVIENVPAHLIVFNPNCFLVMWLGQIRSAVLFHKLSSDDRFSKYI